MEITKNLVSKKMPDRPGNANKGLFGKALIIAGSKNFPGAAILSVLACARVGTGLVTLATSPEVYKVAVPKIPFATFLDFSEIKVNLEKYDTILIGPGLGKSDEIKQMITDLINLNEIKEKKVILDADALNILSEIKEWFKILEMDAIITPHPGEMSRLTNLPVDEIQNNRQKIAEKFAKIWNKTIVLKGAETVIVNPREIFISPFSNPLLATAGTGDVLSGIITGFLAQGLNLLDASVVGVYIHGLAAQNLKEKFGDSGMIATDLIEKIPEVIQDLKFS